MKSIFQFCFVLLCNLICAQNTFLKTYDLFTNSDDQCAWLDLEMNGIHLMNNRLDIYTPTYRIFDLEGKPLSETKMNYASYNYYSPTILKEENSYKILVRSNNDSLSDNLYVYNFNYNGDSIWIKQINDKNKLYKRPIPESFIKTSSHYIVTANGYSYIYPDSITTLASIWFLHHDFSVDTIIPLIRNDYTYTYGAQFGPDGNIYIYLYSNCTGQTPGCINPTRQRSIAVFNEKKWINEYYSEKYVNELYKGRISLVTSDTSMIYGFEKTDNFVTKASIRCIDKEGNLKWESYDNLNGEDINYTFIDELKNGDFLALGYISAENFARAVYLKRISKNGSKIWERIIAKDLPWITYGAEGYVWRFNENAYGYLYIVGQLGGATKDMLLMKVDSFGCVNQDKCNRLYVVDHKKDLYKYDQLDMKQKKWYYTVRTKDGTSYIQEVAIGDDTIMFDDKYGHRRYKHVWFNDVRDTFKLRWDVSGKVGYMTRLNKDIWLGIPKDSILYDFTLKQGDEFTLPKGAGLATVIKTDSIDLMEGGKRKRLTLKFENLAYQNKYGNLIWIEGIGSLNGLFYFYDWINGTKTRINCYYDRDKKRYGESEECNETVISMEAVKYVSVSNEWVNFYNHPLEPIPPYGERYTFSTDSVKWNDKYYFRQLVSKSEFENDFKENRRIFREDNNKIFEGLDVAPGEALIYDFNLNVGDTLRVLAGSVMRNMVCTKVDTVIFLDGNIRKRQEMLCIDSGNKYVWIEGFGEKNLYREYCDEEDEAGYVSCYYYNKTLSYSNSTGNGCWPVGTDELEQNSIRVSPNPTNGALKIESNLNIEKVKVYDLYGQFIKVEKMKNSVDLSNLANGVYILEIDVKNRRVVKKIIKI